MIQVTAMELEYHDDWKNSHKFYRVFHWTPSTPSGAGSLTQWGRIGARGQFKYVTVQAGSSKIDEKQNEGYEFTANSVHFQVPDDIIANKQWDALVIEFAKANGQAAAKGAIARRDERQREEAAELAKQQDELKDDLLELVHSLDEPGTMETKLGEAMTKAKTKQTEE